MLTLYSILTRRVVLFLPVWQSMIQCSTSKRMYKLGVWGEPIVWVLSYSLRVRRANATRYRMPRHSFTNPWQVALVGKPPILVSMQTKFYRNAIGFMQF